MFSKYALNSTKLWYKDVQCYDTTGPQFYMKQQQNGCHIWSGGSDSRGTRSETRWVHTEFNHCNCTPSLKNKIRRQFLSISILMTTKKKSNISFDIQESVTGIHYLWTNICSSGDGMGIWKKLCGGEWECVLFVSSAALLVNFAVAVLSLLSKFTSWPTTSIITVHSRFYHCKPL